MKKEIRFRMTPKRAAEFGYQRYRLAMIPVAVDLDLLSPGAKWLAEHITSTYIVDDYVDQIDILAYAPFTMRERDQLDGRSSDYIAQNAFAFGDFYTNEEMNFTVCFPIYGRKYNSPEELLEAVVRELVDEGVYQLRSLSGEKYDLCTPEAAKSAYVKKYGGRYARR